MQPTAMRPTVFVVDDDEAVRSGLRALLSSAGHHVEVFEAAQQFLDGCAPERPGCLLLDVRMPGMSGLELQEQLAAKRITLPVIILTGHGDVPMAVRALKTGALDFMLKPFDTNILLDRVKDALALDARNRERHAARSSHATRLANLTAREHQVLEMIVAGKANKVIAIELGISERTVELHRAHLMDKMGVRSVAELVQAALAAGSTDAERYQA